MNILHCKDCHHEWPWHEDKGKCQWCGGDSYVLETLEPWDTTRVLEILKAMLNKENLRDEKSSKI